MRLLAKLEQHRSIVLVVCAFVVGILISFPIQYAVAAVTDTTYYACVKTSDGTLRIVSANTTCKASETLISWNQQGPQGPTGPQGPQGPAGSSGSGLPFVTCYKCQLYPYASSFQGQNFDNAQIVGSNFAGADIHGVSFKGAYLDGTDFTSANLAGADFSDLIDAYPQTDGSNNGFFDGARILFTGANLTDAKFTNDIFLGTSFAQANLTRADFSGASFPIPASVFTGENFTQANLQNANFNGAHFIQEDFTGATNMATANLTGVTWDNVTCPDGTNSDSDGNTCVNNLTPAP